MKILAKITRISGIIVYGSPFIPIEPRSSISHLRNKLKEEKETIITSNSESQAFTQTADSCRYIPGISPVIPEYRRFLDNPPFSVCTSL